MTQFLLASDPAAAASLVQDKAATEVPGFGSFIRALQAIVAGSRDRALADAPELNYSMAAEILYLLDKLEEAGK